MKTTGSINFLDLAVSLPVALGWSALAMVAFHSDEALVFSLLPSGASTQVRGPMLLILMSVFGTVLGSLMLNGIRPRLLERGLVLQLLSTVLGALIVFGVSSAVSKSGLAFLGGSTLVSIAGLVYWYGFFRERETDVSIAP